MKYYMSSEWMSRHNVIFLWTEKMGLFPQCVYLPVSFFFFCDSGLLNCDVFFNSCAKNKMLKLQGSIIIKFFIYINRFVLRKV